MRYAKKAASQETRMHVVLAAVVGAFVVATFAWPAVQAMLS